MNQSIFTLHFASPLFLTNRMDDPRFSRARHDPRFRKKPKIKKQVEIDPRFHPKLETDEFAVLSSKVDKFGKKISSKFINSIYDGATLLKPQSEELPEEEFNESDWEDLVMDLIDQEITDRLENREEIKRPELDDADSIEYTTRMAVVDMDWDNISAQDLYVLFSSFLPTESSVVKSVTIYQSNFGKEKMEKERLEGPPSYIFKLGTQQKDTSGQTISQAYSSMHSELSTAQSPYSSWKNMILSSQEDNPFDIESLRKYEAQRRMYYYAVVEFDSVHSAKSVFHICDGIEFEQSGNQLQLSFVPEDMSFENDPVKDRCTSPPKNYVPSLFYTPSLQYTDFGITWDTNDAKRTSLLRKNPDKIDDALYDQYIASDSDEDTAPSSEDASKLRQLFLQSRSKSQSKSQSKSGGVSVSFGQALGTNISDSEDDDDLFTSKPVDLSSIPIPKDVTPQVKMHHEEFSSGSSEEDTDDSEDSDTSDISQQNQAIEMFGISDLDLNSIISGNLEKSMENNFDIRAISSHFKLSKKNDRFSSKKLGSIDKMLLQPSFSIDLDDPRFSQIYLNSLFFIDPNNPSFIETEASHLILKHGAKIRSQLLDESDSEDSDSDNDVPSQHLPSNRIKRQRNFE